jgi:hypothetical protein
VGITIGNSSDTLAPAFLLIGSQEAMQPPTGYGGTLHLEPLLAAPALTIPPAGFTYPLAVPAMPGLFCDFCLQLQTVQLDGGATHGIAFSRCLELVFGR